LARVLAISFYKSALGPETRPPAQILQEERAQLVLKGGRARRGQQAAQDDQPPSLTSLSYQFYGHPQFRLTYAEPRDVL